MPESRALTKPKILMHISRLHKFDGSSTDFLNQLAGLRRNGYTVHAHSRSAPDDCQESLISFEDAKVLAADPNTIVIFAFCGFDRQLHALRKAAKGRFIVRYQNVTPPKWFLPYSPRAFIHAFLGRMQMHFFVKRNRLDLLMPASKFSADELCRGMSAERRPPVCVVPIQSNGEAFQKQSDAFIPPHKKEKNALYVSRLLPHKGLTHLVKLLDAWKQTDAARAGMQLKITIAGKLSAEYKMFLKGIKQDAERREVFDHLTFHTDISQANLIALYQSADVYLCPSEHEGFGIPVVDAQCAGLPVIAIDKGATAETVGDGAVIIETDPVDYLRFAQTVERVLTDEQLRRRLIAAGYKNLDRFTADVVTSQLLDALPARKHPSI